MSEDRASKQHARYGNTSLSLPYPAQSPISTDIGLAQIAELIYSIAKPDYIQLCDGLEHSNQVTEQHGAAPFKRYNSHGYDARADIVDSLVVIMGIVQTSSA
jgi:hypothetical protein